MICFALKGRRTKEKARQNLIILSGDGIPLEMDTLRMAVVK